MDGVDKLFAGAVVSGMVLVLVWWALVITAIVLVLHHFGVV